MRKGKRKRTRTMVMQWNGIRWDGMEWNGREWNETEWKKDKDEDKE